MTAPGAGRRVLPAGAYSEERPWVALSAFAFVVVALVALAVAPAILLQQISRVTAEINQTILPAYDGVRDLAFAMEQRVSASRSYFVTGDPVYQARLAEARVAEEAALRTVAEVAPRLGAPAVGHLEALRRNIALRDRVEAELIRSGQGMDAYREAVPRFDQLRDAMLAELQGLRQELVRLTRERAAMEARWAGLQRLISAVLGTLALLAALAVGWFAWDQQRLRREVLSTLHEANRLREIAERRGDDLERATEARIRLLRGITHDLKNPLGAAKGYAELLELGVKTPLVPEQRPFVEGIQRSVDGALGIIADLLDLARADSGGLSIERTEVDLRAVARAAAADHRSAAEAAGHTLEVEAPEEALPVHTDPARVEQILGNLLSNAIKYTPPPGRVCVQPAAGGPREAQREGAWATIRVSDTGPGIPPEQREAIFDEFTRLDEGSAQKGHGLGLAIARRIARLLAGDLSVEDTPGRGATFVLWLPVRQPEEPTLEQAAQSSAQDERLAAR